MPTILRWKGWTFLFYSADWREPPHVHARKGGRKSSSGLTIAVLPLHDAYPIIS